MTPSQLGDYLDRTGLSLHGLGRLVDVSERTVRRWMSGAQAIPEGLESELRNATDDEVDDAMGRVL